MYGIIYKVENLQNGKIYIGQTTQTLKERKYHHYYRAEHELNITNTHFINALRKYNKDDFQWEQIDSAENQEELNQKEIFWIKKYDSVNKGYNIQNGGQNYISDKFAIACGSKPFYAYKANGNFLGEFINRRAFGRKYHIAQSHITDVLKGKYNSCNGFIFIWKDEFTQEKLDTKLANVKQTFRPFIAIKLDTLERFGPYLSMKDCREELQLKNNHISEILAGKRKSQEGYTFKFID